MVVDAIRSHFEYQPFAVWTAQQIHAAERRLELRCSQSLAGGGDCIARWFGVIGIAGSACVRDPRRRFGAIGESPRHPPKIHATGAVGSEHFRPLHSNELLNDKRARPVYGLVIRRGHETVSVRAATGGIFQTPFEVGLREEEGPHTRESFNQMCFGNGDVVF